MIDDETATEKQAMADECPTLAYKAGMAGWDGPLTAGTLIPRAETLTGLSDWGGSKWEEDRFRHDFALLCDGIEDSGAVSAIGRHRSYARLMTLLVSRLRYLDARKSTPNVDEQRILAPLIGTGMPRAGTTFLHGVIAQDPDMRVARAFEAVIPVPLRGDGGDQRAEIYEALIAYQGMTDPKMRAIHPFGADLPEECLFMQEGACTGFFGGFWHVPAFMDAVADKTAAAYQWQIGVMQYLQADGEARRWALKTPAHIMAWNDMRLAFPDALIYVNHRDPARVVPSMASLMAALRGLFSDQPTDLAAIGREQLAIWAQAMKDYAAWRRSASANIQVVDINFTDLVADPLAVVTQLYDRFGLHLTDIARDRMERHLAIDSHGKGPQRQYSLQEFGMDDTDIEAAFGDYIEQFGITRERGPRA
ncbi:sulfotransferase [Sphingobium sp. HBC34]|uniref:Sulfotransferase n=1 Tax=Sphingobium cyanobacteriorum TaxID=3063954 RepID=A0ABT8ZKD7_9SPHN|nr:sulfotransferase [Sphingobium sp. HBC34]MDO7835004.1 sulfotransferase [Sphingobium sp. HBC34]